MKKNKVYIVDDGGKIVGDVSIPREYIDFVKDVGEHMQTDFYGGMDYDIAEPAECPFCNKGTAKMKLSTVGNDPWHFWQCTSCGMSHRAIEE